MACLAADRFDHVDNVNISIQVHGVNIDTSGRNQEATMEPRQRARSHAVTTVRVEHVQIRTEVPAAEVIRRIEATTGVFDAARFQALVVAKAPVPAILEAIEGMAGESGFMRFAALDHGVVARLEGHPLEAVRFLIGHPLIAARMTKHDAGSALYAPLSLLVASEGSGARVEYDRPSSILGQFDHHAIVMVAAELDAKLAALIDSATG
jgi:hypothetical protein